MLKKTKSATKCGMKISNGKNMSNNWDIYWKLSQFILIFKQQQQYFLHFIGSEWFANQQKFTIPIEEQSKEELNKCLQVFYTFVRPKNGSEFKVSSLKAIRAAIDRFLKQMPNNKPWSIVGDPNLINDTIEQLVGAKRSSSTISP